MSLGSGWRTTPAERPSAEIRIASTAASAPSEPPAETLAEITPEPMPTPEETTAVIEPPAEAFRQEPTQSILPGRFDRGPSLWSNAILSTALVTEEPAEAEPTRETTQPTEAADTEESTREQAPESAFVDAVPHADNEPPRYPPRAVSLRIQGEVLLRLHIDASGRVSHIDVLRSVPLLTHAAVRAAKTWHYEPAREGTTPRPTAIDVPFVFELTRSR